MNIDGFMDGIEAKAAAAIKAEQGDYIGDDGLLYCGKCNTAKQSRIEIFGKVRTPMCLCKCAAERLEREEEERKRVAFMREVMRMRRAGFPDEEMQNWTFANDDLANEKLSGIARNYVEHFPEMLKQGKGLLLYGPTGTGKTFAAACIANALIDKGYPCLVTKFSRLRNALQGIFDGKQEFIDSLNKYAVLVLDDLDSEGDTEYMGEIVHDIIDNRCLAKLPLIVTTNTTAKEMKAPAGIRKKRIYSRLFEMTVPVPVEGEDRRRKKLSTDYDEYRDLLGL